MSVNLFCSEPSKQLSDYIAWLGKTVSLPEETRDKLQKLGQVLQKNAPVAIALSGGVDSTFLAMFAKKILQEDMVAVTAKCDNFAPDELEYSEKFCKENGINHVFTDISWEALSSLYSNPVDRCYICKKIVLGEVAKVLNEVYPNREYKLMDGTNASDAQDYRPGVKALEELGVLSPLKLSGLVKDEIRLVLRRMDMPIWDKPAFACLASRIPYGEEITKEKLHSVYKLETYLRELGFRQVRVRCHTGGVARIEVLPTDFNKFFNEDFMNAVNGMAVKSGFTYAALDLAGYKMGNLNKNL